MVVPTIFQGGSHAARTTQPRNSRCDAFRDTYGDVGDYDRLALRQRRKRPDWSGSRVCSLTISRARRRPPARVGRDHSGCSGGRTRPGIDYDAPNSSRRRRQDKRASLEVAATSSGSKARREGSAVPSRQLRTSSSANTRTCPVRARGGRSRDAAGESMGADHSVRRMGFRMHWRAAPGSSSVSAAMPGRRAAVAVSSGGHAGRAADSYLGRRQRSLLRNRPPCI